MCDQGKEETNHLFAYCTGLAPSRMKICGLATLPEPFGWTPVILLSMIWECEKICPEEGQLNIEEIEHGIPNTGNNFNSMTE
jgi:hypothetical protein